MRHQQLAFLLKLRDNLINIVHLFVIRNQE